MGEEGPLRAGSSGEWWTCPPPYSGQRARGSGCFAPNRRPDVILRPQAGVIYTTTSVATKRVERGGFTEENTSLPLVLAGPGVEFGTVTRPVDLRQVAPTILKALGLSRLVQVSYPSAPSFPSRAPFR
jgi:hypothetical protein